MKIRTGKESDFDINLLNSSNRLDYEITNENYVIGISSLLSKEDFNDNECRISIQTLNERLKTYRATMKEVKQEIPFSNYFRFDELYKAIIRFFAFYQDNSIVIVNLEETNETHFIYNENQEILSQNLSQFLINNTINYVSCIHDERDFLQIYQRFEDCHFVKKTPTKELLKKLGLESRQETFTIYEIFTKTSNDNNLIRTDLLNSKKYLFLNLNEDLKEWRIRGRFVRYETGCHKFYCVINPETYISAFDICNLLK